MAGLSSTYISNKLAAEGTTASTQELVLVFLNHAPNASPIVGIEPQEGPVDDDPREKYGD
jgi:hypothetical protein